MKNDISKPELSSEDQAIVFQIARNFQHDPQKVVELIRKMVGTDKLQVSLDFLKTIAQ